MDLSFLLAVILISFLENINLGLFNSMRAQGLDMSALRDKKIVIAGGGSAGMGVATAIKKGLVSLGLSEKVRLLSFSRLSIVPQLLVIIRHPLMFPILHGVIFQSPCLFSSLRVWVLLLLLFSHFGCVFALFTQEACSRFYILDVNGLISRERSSFAPAQRVSFSRYISIYAFSCILSFFLSFFLFLCS